MGAAGLEENWRAVASAINARMVELPMTQRELADRSGVSVATLRELQHATAARKRSDRTLAAVSDALGWPEGYLKAVLNSGAPPARGVGKGAASDDLSVVLARLDQLHGEVRRIADAVDRLTADERSP